MNETKSVKALKKQLAAAIAMVMVAAIALASSTYAWFASNNTVTADGMSISAKAEGAILEISDSTKSYAGKTSATSEETITGGLYPTWTENGATWIHAYSDDYSKAVTDYSTTTQTDVSDVVKTDKSSKYALVSKFYLRLNDLSSDDAAVNNINAKINITSESKMTDVGTIALKVGETWFTGLKDNSTATDVINTITKTSGDVEVLVYFYIDGKADNCTSEKFDANNFSATITFEGTAANTAA